MHPALRRLTLFLTRHIDGVLLSAILLLMFTGLLVLLSASNGNFVRTSGQLGNMLVALGVMWLFANIPPHYLQRLSVPVFLIGIALLVGVALFGDIVNGARRWLHVGVTRIQPSELMKIGLPLMLAWYFNRNEASLKLRNYFIAALILILPAALIARQPDLGTAILITASGCYVIFLAGLPWRVIIALSVAGMTSMPFLWSALHDYQRQRILTLLDPTTDPLGTGYHTIQSTIAVGSGGILVIAAQCFRSQPRNREDARERLAALIREAATPPKLRRATRPSKAAKRRRVDDKRQLGARKRERSGSGWD